MAGLGLFDRESVTAFKICIRHRKAAPESPANESCVFVFWLCRFLWGGRRHRSRTGHWGGQKTIFARGSDRRSKLPWHSSLCPGASCAEPIHEGSKQTKAHLFVPTQFKATHSSLWRQLREPRGEVSPAFSPNLPTLLLDCFWDNATLPLEKNEFFLLDNAML